MGSQRIEHRATTAADPATVYALLRDGAGWPGWSPIDSFELERPGAGEPEGVGAVRLFRGGGVTGRDTIVELVADRRFSYTHTSNLPVRNYRPDVDLEPVAEGTAIRWVSTFDPEVARHRLADAPRARRLHREADQRPRRALRGGRRRAQRRRLSVTVARVIRPGY